MYYSDSVHLSNFKAVLFWICILKIPLGIYVFRIYLYVVTMVNNSRKLHQTDAIFLRPVLFHITKYIDFRPTRVLMLNDLQP